MKPEEKQGVRKEEDRHKRGGHLHDAHRVDMAAVGHRASRFGHAQGVVHKVHFATANRSFDILGVDFRVGDIALLPAVDDWDGGEEDNCNTKVCNQDDWKSVASRLLRRRRRGFCHLDV